jgi:hypothetical protein
MVLASSSCMGFFLAGGFCVALVAHDCLAAIRYAKSALISWEFESFKPI